MLWAVWCKDSSKAAEIRGSYTKQHSAHLTNSPIPIVIAGPLVSNDGAASVGSLLIFEAATLQEVEQVVASDPFTQSGVWASAEIAAFKMSRNNTNASAAA